MIKDNKVIITYGTFDYFHEGHLNILRRAKELGAYLIVGVTSESYDIERGKLNVHNSCVERVENVRKTGLADKIIIEEYEGQKIDDIQKYDVDIFVLGSDWCGYFDYLKEYCEVVYLERTRGISSTDIRQQVQKIINIGIIGTGRIANRFVPESKFVSGVNVVSAYNPKESSAVDFCKKNQLKSHFSNLHDFLNSVDAVYIASPHTTHYYYILEALKANKHVLCEKPIVLEVDQLKELQLLAQEKKLVLMDAIKTAYCAGFTHLVSMIKAGAIGEVKDIDATFTKLVKGNIRELDKSQAGGSITELSPYCVLPIMKILGTDYKELQYISKMENGVDVYTKANFIYNNATATFKVGLGVKSEGDLTITGTKGYAYIPSPWWKTDYFELRFEDLRDTRKYFYRFDDDGLRYEIKDFIQNIKDFNNYKLSNEISIGIIKIIEDFKKGINVININ